MPLRFSGQSCEASWPGGVKGQQRNPSQVALQKPKKYSKRKTLIDFYDMNVPG